MRNGTKRRLHLYTHINALMHKRTHTYTHTHTHTHTHTQTHTHTHTALHTHTHARVLSSFATYAIFLIIATAISSYLYNYKCYLT